jgi:uncharacterized repeat protein (TIGR02543 family)
LISAYFSGAQPAGWNSSVFTGTASGFIIYYHISQAESWSGYTNYIALPFCSLTLDLQDGGPCLCNNHEVISSNGNISVPSDPTRPGYIFCGWYKDESCTDIFDFSNEVVSDDIQLYAAWMTWDLNGDHICDVSDLVSIGLHWGQAGTSGWIKEDLNRDGIIDVCDLVQIGLYWGRSY